MSTSAFGIDHGEFSKADKEPEYSSGRRNLATYYGTTHSLYAAKKGKRLRSMGRSELYGSGGALGGGGAGAALGALATKGKPVGAVTGAVGGAVTGAMVGNNRAFHQNNKRGYYKTEQ